jgi:hypothetical protein
MTFLVVLVVGALAVGGLVYYVGVRGDTGTSVLRSGPTPGNESGTTGGAPTAGPLPAACEGKGALGNFTFSLEASSGPANGGRNFNGTVPGPCLAVAVGSNVTIVFSVASGGAANHSWVLIAPGGSATSLPAFPGAGSANGTRLTGIAPGGSMTFHFRPTATGADRYISEVAGDYKAGMWGLFNVTADPATAVDGEAGAPASTGSSSVTLAEAPLARAAP